MPLSEQEQRLLDEMERNLYHNDADFVATVGGGGGGRPNYTSIVVGVLVALLGVGVLVAGVVLRQPLIGVLGFAVMFAGVLVAVTPRRAGRGSRGAARSVGARPASAAPRAKAQRKRGFMDSLGDRWDRRQDGR